MFDLEREQAEGDIGEEDPDGILRIPVTKLLSAAELSHLRRYAAIRTAHLQRSVFSHMPDIAAPSPEDKEAFASSMRPSLFQHVFVRMNEDFIAHTATGDDIQAAAGSSQLVQYRFVKQAIREGKAVL